MRAVCPPPPTPVLEDRIKPDLNRVNQPPVFRFNTIKQHNNKTIEADWGGMRGAKLLN